MYSKEVEVINKTGLHARPASTFVQEAKKYKSKITITNTVNGKSGDAKSIIKVLSLGMVKGTKIRLDGDGEDENLAIDSLVSLIESGFGE